MRPDTGSTENLSERSRAGHRPLEARTAQRQEERDACDSCHRVRALRVPQKEGAPPSCCFWEDLGWKQLHTGPSLRQFYTEHGASRWDVQSATEFVQLNIPLTIFKYSVTCPFSPELDSINCQPDAQQHNHPPGACAQHPDGRH